LQHPPLPLPQCLLLHLLRRARGAAELAAALRQYLYFCTSKASKLKTPAAVQRARVAAELAALQQKHLTHDTELASLQVCICTFVLVKQADAVFVLLY